MTVVRDRIYCRWCNNHPNVKNCPLCGSKDLELKTHQIDVKSDSDPSNISKRQEDAGKLRQEHPETQEGCGKVVKRRGRPPKSSCQAQA